MLNHWSLLCLLVLLAGTFSGCVQDDVPEPTHATAKEAAQNAAEEHRNQTGQDLEILGIFGIGMPGASEAQWAPYGVQGEQRQETLEHAVDGRLSRWGMIHATPGADTPYTMSPYGLPGTTSGTGVGFDHTTHPFLMEVFGNLPLEPDGDWLDSDAALEKAAEGNARILDFLEDGEADLLMFLQHVTGRSDPHWFIQVAPRTGGTPILALVDASTGETLRAENVYVEQEPERTGATVTARRGTEWGFDAGTLDRPSLSVQVLPRNSTALNDLYDIDAQLRLPVEESATLELEGEWPQIMNLTHLRNHTGTYTLVFNASLVDDADDMLPDAAWPEVQIDVCLDGIRPDPLGLVPRGECMGGARAPSPR